MILTDELRNLLNKSNSYKRLFIKNGNITEDGKTVLKDLAKFCKANQSTIMISPVSRTVDPIASAINEGRREVYLRIAEYLKLDEADYLKPEEMYNDETT